MIFLFHKWDCLVPWRVLQESNGSLEDYIVAFLGKRLIFRGFCWYRYLSVFTLCFFALLKQVQSTHLNRSNLASPFPYHFGSVNAKHAQFGFGAMFHETMIMDDYGRNTLPKTNIAPENRPSQKETSIPTIHF